MSDAAALQARVRIEQTSRASERLQITLFLASFTLVLAILVPGAAASRQDAANRRAQYTTAPGVVVNGRGTAPDTSELLVEFTPPGDTSTQQWMPVEGFFDYEVGTQVTVVYPNDQVHAAQIEAECDCLPRAVPVPFPILMFLPLMVAFVVYRLIVRRRRVDPSASRTSVLAWWAGPRSSTLRLYAHVPDPASGPSAGPMLGAVFAPRSYRSAIRDGDVLTLHGELAPGKPVRLAVSGLDLSGTLRLGKPTLATDKDGRSEFGLNLASIGRSKEVIGPEEARRLELVDAVRFGVAPLFVLLFAFTFPMPWNAAAVLGLVPVAANVFGLAWARLGSQDDKVSAERSPTPPPPPAPPSPELAKDLRTQLFLSASEDDRTLAETGYWLGSRITFVVAFVPILLLLIVSPGLIPVSIVAGIVFWRRSPRPVIARFRRPALPTVAAVAVLTGTVFCWQIVFQIEGWEDPPVVRVVAGVLWMAIAVLGIRLATAGLTIGRDEWVVRNVFRTTRIPAQDIAAVTLRPDRGIIPSAGLLIHRRTADDVVVSRWALSRLGAKRVIRHHDEAEVPPYEPQSPDPDRPVPVPTPSVLSGWPTTPTDDHPDGYGRIF